MLVKAYKYIVETFSNKDVRNKFLFTIAILGIYRLLANIPLPGIDMDVYQTQFGSVSTSESSYLLTIFTGGQLETPSIVGLGIGVYITASIVMQLLTSVIPKLEELSKEGARGTQVISQYTRYLTVPLSIVYSVGYIFLLSQQNLGSDPNNPVTLIPTGADGAVSVTKVIFMTLILTAGSLFLMWLAELITEKGVGNGASIILTVGILSGLPVLINIDFASLQVDLTFQRLIAGELDLLVSPALIAMYLIVIGTGLLVAGIVFMTESTRKIPIQYARRMREGGATQQSNLPLKLNQSGVLPIIFAASLLTTPQIILPVLQQVTDPSSPVGEAIANIANSSIFATGASQTVEYNLLYFGLVVVFGMFYAFIALKPDEVAENLQKSGGFIPGIRPGDATANYITKVMLRLTTVGSILLAIIALIPTFAGVLLGQVTDGQQFTIFTGIGGTSILIIVGVILETLRQVESLKATNDYERFV